MGENANNVSITACQGERMTLSAQQRINVALATGMRVRGTMNYECLIRHLTARPSQKAVQYSFVVDGDTPSDAAREAAARVAKKHYRDGEAGFVQEVGENSFVGIVGQQSLVAERGVVTYGFSITVTVRPVPTP
jgi:hypothetical protein